MLDVATVHPMLRRKRRRRWRVTPVVRLITLLTLSAVLAIGGAVALLRRELRPDPRMLLANSLATLEAGNYSAARSNALAAVVVAPEAGIAHAVLARAYLELGEGLAAEAVLARARTARFPASRLHQLQAHARLLQGDAAGALAEVALTAPRYELYARRVRARALAVQGRTFEARAALEVMVDEAPTDERAWLDLGRLRLTAGDIGGASAAAERATRLRPADPHALTLEGEIVRARYGLIAALPWFEAALKRDAYHYPALIEYAATLGEAGRHADMLAALRPAMQARPGSAQAMYLQAVLAARAGKLQLASALLGRVDKSQPGALLLGGALDYTAGRWEQAVAKWRPLADAQPMNLSVRRSLAAALLRAGDAQGALVVLRPLAMRGDADSYALTLTGRALEVVGDRVSAAQFLDRAASAARGSAAVFRSDEAVATLAAGASATPSDPTYALGVIRGLIGSGDPAGGTAKARALALASPGAPAAWTAYGDALALAGRPADPAFSRSANLLFDEPAMLRLLDAQGRAGHAREAAATLALYLSQNPRSVAVRRLLGALQVRAGEWKVAVRTLEGVRRQVGSSDAALLVDLAWAYAGAGDAATARRLARMAYILQPMNVAAADAYGVALATAGRMGAARQLLDKAVALAPGDRRIAEHRQRLG